jgi:ankyrin repeat protein
MRPLNNIGILLTLLKKEGKTLDKMTKDEIRKFCEKISPRLYGHIQNFLGKIEVTFHEFDYPHLLEDISFCPGEKVRASVSSSRGLDKEVKKITDFSGVYTKDELKVLLHKLKELSLKNESETSSLAFHLIGNSHSLTLSYDSQKSTWILVESNKELWRRKIKFEGILAKILMQALSESGAILLSVSIYGAQRSAVSISKEEIRELYEITPEKINFLSKENISWFFIACFNGQLDVAQFLFENGANVNETIGGGATPLLVACQNGRLDVVQFLLKNGADIDQATDSRTTPLLKACYNNHLKVVDLLLKYNPKINLAKKDGSTPLFVACKNGLLNIVLLLLSHGANVNQVRKDGSGPLFVACQNGFLKIAQLLLKHGADINKARGDGLTPLSMARGRGHSDIVDLLLEEGLR